MKKLFSRLYANHIVRYVFFGGLTTLVNLGAYTFLRLVFHMNLVIANVISVALSILFAFVVNSMFVFESKAGTLQEHFQELIKFVSARLSTMLIEVAGVWFMADVIHMNDMAAKLVLQIVIMVLNYIFSKFLVFTRKDG